MKRGFRHKTYVTKTDGSQGLFRRRLVSWLGLFLLVFNVLGASALPARSAEAGPAPFAQEFLGDRIVVCTAAGMVVMDLNGNVVGTGDTSAAHSDFCVYCLPLMHGGAQLPAAVLLPLDIVYPGAAVFVPAEPAVAHVVRLPGTASPRAPPLA